MHAPVLAVLFLIVSPLAAASISTLEIPGLRNPYGLTIGPDGALYVCDIDNHVIWRAKDSQASVVAGTLGKRGYSGDGGAATNALLNEPYEVRFDSAGTMYFVEMRNHLIRKVQTNGTISTIAGQGQPGFSGDGNSARHASFNQPHSIQLDRSGNLFICDIGNHRIRRIDAQTSLISTFSGNGERKPTPDGAKFAHVPLNGPRAIDFAPNGDLWLALREGNAIYRSNRASDTLHHVAGTGAKGQRDGPALEATLSGPKGISVGPDGAIYFADTESHTIRRVRNGVVETVAGTGTRGDGPDGDPLRCALARPHGIYVSDRIYIGDSENNKVRVLSIW
jgi:streptogramin lyase